ncbi:hypothetical protein MIND_00146000 [Mycena indigotica]|uniref:Glycosyl transferase family 25 domain-containing protein n=1 Tax=Mycena indigotica TaxID=2126181 RepID=A0A8H6TCW5_9AGAR|nr:uncharacterized protein MIND_00146000 [Mycena indigotica]KAF7316273.1 hypothetical protein MIND_00146000 [Mycena indigotica]
MFPRTLFTVLLALSILCILVSNNPILLFANSRHQKQLLPIPSQTLVINLARRYDRRRQMEILRSGLRLAYWTYLPAEDHTSSLSVQLLQTVQAIRAAAFKDFYYDSDSTVALPFSWPTQLESSPFDDISPVFSLPDPAPPLTCATEDFTVEPYSPALKHYRVLTRNRVACWHSHLSAIKRAVSQPTLILEDDVDMEVDISERLRSVWSSLPLDWDILYLGHCWSNESYFPPLPSQEPSLVRLHPSNAPLCTHAYAVSPTGALRLLLYLTHPPFAYSRAIDHALAWLVQNRLVRAYSVVPSIVVQRKISNSDVTIDGRASTWRDDLTKGFFA